MYPWAGSDLSVEYRWIMKSKGTSISFHAGTEGYLLTKRRKLMSCAAAPEGNTQQR
jgi:hypothetical protein